LFFQQFCTVILLPCPSPRVAADMSSGSNGSFLTPNP
jgi:hypothetical protein